MVLSIKIIKLLIGCTKRAIGSTTKIMQKINLRMSKEIDRTLYVLPLNQPVSTLDVIPAFEGLTAKEKQYAYHLSQSAWIGGLITLLQTSAESAPIFVLLHKLFRAQKPADLKASALCAGLSEEDVTAFFVYAAGIFSNLGNYKGFGDTKFIPDIQPTPLENLLKLSPIWPELQPLWQDVKESLYDLKPGRTCLGYPPEGCTTYFSKNHNEDDNTRVQAWLKKQNFECYNTRLFKTESDGKTSYEIRLASDETGELKCETEGEYEFRITKGDYSPILRNVSLSLKEAVHYAANPTQVNMLNAYVDSFTTGSLQAHKDGSRFWIQDKSPAVETYIGFIETYRDPAGVRGEFECFVSVVNRPMSEKFSRLVEAAEEFLLLLPWPRGFEKDSFLRPDFTSLDVLTFASSGVPAGINIPNYDDIRQSEGFKNVSLGNVIPASYHYSNTPFLSESDIELLKQYRLVSFELQVGLHELLGHGSGKLLKKDADGSLNYSSTLIDPLTGLAPTSCYEMGDTYDVLFGAMSSPYEECRAEAVGLYLSLEPSVLKIFGHGSEAEDVVYVNWLSLIWAGAGRALEMWDPNRGWLQAHSQARFVLTRVLMQAGVVSVEEHQPGDLRISLDRKSMYGAGRQAIGHFLLQLQIYKATANVNAARELFQHYSEVAEPWISWRSIILANKQPRKMLVQPNLVLENGEVKISTYDASLDGIINSWVERYIEPDTLYKNLLQLSEADRKYFI